MAHFENIKKLQTALKLNGFTIRREFCSQLVEKFVESNLNLASGDVFDEMVRNICCSFETQCLSRHSIETKHIDRALEVCLRAGCDQNETILSVINAFDFPKLTYNQDRKMYFLDLQKSTLFPDADVKAKMFVDRYSAVLQRTKRCFQQTGVIDEKTHLQLQTVDFLLTLTELQLDRILVLGSLLQVAEGKYFLEDPTGMVELDLTHAKYHPGFFSENCIVLVNGYYEDKILHVSTMILPPGEEYAVSRPTFGNINYFGGNSDVPLKDSKRLKARMLENSDGMFLFLSDVWLDYPQVFDQLDKLFNQIGQFMQPIAFVFMGNFLLESHGSEMMSILRKLFKRLAELISRYHALANSSHFIFVPGLADPCTPQIVPRLELPNYVTEDVKRILPNAIFATNPCRIQYCTKEIVVFRADLLAKFLQGTLHTPAKEDIPKYIARTIVSQGHLSPLSLNVLTVYWDFDYCFSLYPLPDMIVIGDKFEAYSDSYKNCIVMNPGQFCNGDFSFKMYYPNKNIDEALEDCVINVVDTDMDS